MNLNLNDPDSIVRWWRCFPERHWLYLEVFEERTPQFRGAIRNARRLIQADPLFDPSQIDALVHAAPAGGAPSHQAPSGDERATEGVPTCLH